MEESQPRMMSTTAAFMSRMEGDVQARRREKFINELSAHTHTPTRTQPPCRHVEPTAPSHRPRTEKHPNFKPSMLEPPKPKFKAVSLEGGPIIKEHSRRNTGLETKRPYQWGPLGGYY